MRDLEELHNYITRIQSLLNNKGRVRKEATTYTKIKRRVIRVTITRTK